MPTFIRYRFNGDINIYFGTSTYLEGMDWGQNLPVQSLLRGKALFCNANLQANTFVGKAQPCRTFHLGGIAPYRYVPVLVLSMLVVALKYCFSCTFLHIASQTTQIIYAGGPMRMRFGISLSWRDVHFLY